MRWAHLDLLVSALGTFIPWSWGLDGSVALDAWGRGAEGSQLLTRDCSEWGWVRVSLRMSCGCFSEELSSAPQGPHTLSKTVSPEGCRQHLCQVAQGRGAQWRPVPVEARNILWEESKRKKMSKYLFVRPTPHPLQTLTSYQAPTESVSRDFRQPSGRSGRSRGKSAISILVLVNVSPTAAHASCFRVFLGGGAVGGLWGRFLSLFCFLFFCLSFWWNYLPPLYSKGNKGGIIFFFWFAFFSYFWYYFFFLGEKGITSASSMNW